MSEKSIALYKWRAIFYEGANLGEGSY